MAFTIHEQSPWVRHDGACLDQRKTNAVQFGARIQRTFSGGLPTQIIELACALEMLTSFSAGGGGQAYKTVYSLLAPC